MMGTKENKKKQKKKTHTHDKKVSTTGRMTELRFKALSPKKKVEVRSSCICKMKTNDNKKTNKAKENV